MYQSISPRVPQTPLHISSALKSKKKVSPRFHVVPAPPVSTMSSHASACWYATGIIPHTLKQGNIQSYMSADTAASDHIPPSHIANISTNGCGTSACHVQCSPHVGSPYAARGEVFKEQTSASRKRKSCSSTTSTHVSQTYDNDNPMRSSPVRHSEKRPGSVESDFVFDANEHRKKVIGLYSEKGGVGKTNFILGAVRSNIYNKILIIDTNPQNHVVNGFVSPLVLRSHPHTFLTTTTFVTNGVLKNVFQVRIAPNRTKVHLIFGDKIPLKMENMYDAERSNQKRLHAKKSIEHIRQALKDYDVVLIDFNSNMSLVNRILLMACDEVIQLVTGDIHSQSAITSLIKVRDEECKYFNVEPRPEDSQEDGKVSFEPQRFHITIVPSLIERIRPEHNAFIQHIIRVVKEKAESDVYYRGCIGRSQSICGIRPVSMMTHTSTEARHSADTAAMMHDIRRVLTHCIQGTSEHVEDSQCIGRFESRSEKDTRPRELATLSILRAPTSDSILPPRYEIRTTTTTRHPHPHPHPHTTHDTSDEQWELVKAWHASEAMVVGLENKLLDYFSTNSDKRHVICVDGEDSRSTLFHQMIQDLDKQDLVESLLFES